jgi:hypothetical protein
LVAGGPFGGVVAGDVAAGAGSSGTAGADVGGGATFAGWVPKPFSRTERGAEVWVDIN